GGPRSRPLLRPAPRDRPRGLYGGLCRPGRHERGAHPGDLRPPDRPRRQAPLRRIYAAHVGAPERQSEGAGPRSRRRLDGPPCAGGSASMTSPTTAMVLAAGLGTRMRPLTNDRPKALVEVGGKALIDHVLDRLAEAGVTDAVVNVHWFADRLESQPA